VLTASHPPNNTVCMGIPSQSRFIGLCLAALLLTWASLAPAAEPVRLVCDEWPPYQLQTKDGVTGFAVETVSAVFKAMDVPIESINAYPWKRALTDLEQGQADALFSANYTAERETFARYPEEPIVMSPWVIWTRKGDKPASLETLKGRKVGVVLGYSYTKEFWNFITANCTVETVTADKINFLKLENGRLDATVAEYGNGMHLMQTMGLKDIVPASDIVIKADGLYIIFRKERFPESFTKQFSDELRRFKQTGEYKALQAQYFGTAE